MSIVECMRRNSDSVQKLLDGGGRIVRDCGDNGHRDGKYSDGTPYSVDTDNVHVEWAVGRVLTTRERNGYDDSDFYAVIWDGETIRSYEYATTRFYSYHNSAGADATPETVAAADEWARARMFDTIRAEAAREASKPTVGKTVSVVRGRKVAKGTTGRVGWAGRNRAFSDQHAGWAYHPHGTDRVRIDLEDGTRVFVDAANVEVVDPGDYMADEDEVKTVAARYNWSSYWGYRAGLAPGFSYVA